MTTQLFIFSTSNLYRMAWQALLEKQPGIVIAGMAGQVADLSHLRWQPPTTVLVDVPTIQTDFVNQLFKTVPDGGLLFLVESYDLKEIISLLRAGATGFINHDATVSELSLGIIAARRGEIFLPPELATQALMALARGKWKSLPLPSFS